MTLDTFQKKFRLTERERQTAGLLSHGASRKEIAAGMGLEMCTVRFHLKNLRRKIDAPSMMAATAFCAARVSGPL